MKRPSENLLHLLSCFHLLAAVTSQVNPGGCLSNLTHMLEHMFKFNGLQQVLNAFCVLFSAFGAAVQNLRVALFFLHYFVMPIKK